MEWDFQETLGHAPSRDSWNSSYMSSSKYASWLNQTQSYYNQYHTNVSFTGVNYEVNIGESITINDSNGVLCHYPAFIHEKNGITFSHDNGSNDLRINVSNNASNDKITFNTRDYGIYELMPNGTQYSSETMSNYISFEFTSGTVQNMMFSNFIDPFTFSVSVRAQSGKLQVKKINNLGNPVENCTFEVYSDSDCTNKVASGTSNSNGELFFEKLKSGTYWVKEISVPHGYLLDTNVKSVDIVAGQTATVEFKNNEPTGKIIVYKVNDNDDKVSGAVFSVRAEQDIKNVAGTKIFYTKGQEVIQITSAEGTGIAETPELPLGSYSVREIQVPIGYLLNETTYEANLEYVNENTPVVELKIEGIVNEEPTGTISIVKRDSKTGSVPQGDATLKGAIYKVYANDDIYNVARTKRFYSKGDLVATRTTNEQGVCEDVTGLPLGKYIVKEEKAPEGYLIDKTEYEVNLEYKDQYTKIITKNVESLDKVNEMQVHIFKSGIKVNSGKTPGLAGVEFTIKLNSDVENALSKGYNYAEIWNGIDEYGNKVNVDSNRVNEARIIAPTYAVIVTDKNGDAYTGMLPYGNYIVKETLTPKDYETASDFSFTISEDESEVKDIAKKVKNIVVNNEQTETYIKLIKKDLKTGKNISLNNATFEIRAKEDVYDRATGKILYKKGEAVSQKLGSTRYTSFTTNAKNLVVPNNSYINGNDILGMVITPLKLEVGLYEISEIKVPNGFLQLDKPITFKVDGIKNYDKDEEGDFIKEIVINNEQPTGTLILDKSVAVREDVDTSFVDVSDLSGIKFKLTAKEDILDMADGSKIYEKGQEIGTYKLDKEGNLKIEKLPMGKYELEEIETLPGLVLDTTKHEIEFKQEDTTTKVYTQTKEIKNDTTVVEFSKTDITGQEELVGAELTVLDENGEIIDSWTSTEKTHKIEGLLVGKKYILREQYAPDSFVQASDVEFTVENTNEIQKVTMIDKVVEISKVDIAGEELEGATLVVTNKRTKNIVDKWTSGKEPHKVSGLIEGENYVLHEEISIDGYVKASDIEFTVSYDKETQKVEMIDKIVSVKKTDFVTGDEVEGAKLVVTDKDGNVVDEWTSGKEEHYVTGLVEGETYTLTEKTCPYGYEVAESIEFTVTEDKETQLIEMKDMPILTDVRLVKVDSATKEVIKDNFKFGIYENPECTKLIKEVESDKENGTVIFDDLRYGIYYAKELKSPNGYVLSDKTIKIEINDKGVFVNDNKIESSEDGVYSFEFENVKTETPKTGNNSNMPLWIALLTMSAISVAGIGVHEYKKRKSLNK